MFESRFPKLITRDTEEGLTISELRGKVRYTSDWENVEGGQGVTARTWINDGIEFDMDGADIKIEAGGYTPVQYVNSAEVVVDAPESGEAYCVSMDPQGTIYINVFDEKSGGQMVWTKGMIITWIAKTDVKITEFESPKFSGEMFTNIPDKANEFQGKSIKQYMDIVRELRNVKNNL